MTNAASSRLQTNHVIESKNTSFTVTHLVFKIKEVPSKTENGGKNDWTFTMSTFILTHQRAKVRQRLLFSLFEPSGSFHVVQLNLSWRHSRSSLTWPLFFFSTTSIASLPCFWRQQQGSRIDIGKRGDWLVSVGEDRQNSVALETAEHHQPLLNDLLAVLLVTGKGKLRRKLSVGRT